MPQVPYNPVPGVAPTNISQQPFFTPAAGPDSFGAGIGRGLATLGDSLGNIAERQQTLALQHQNFNLTEDSLKLSEWATQDLNERIQKAQGTDARGLSAGAVEAYDKQAAARLANIQNPELRAKWKVQYAQGRNSVFMAAYKEQLKILDQTTKGKLSNSFDIIDKKIAANPDATDSFIEEGYKVIDQLPADVYPSPEVRKELKEAWKQRALIVKAGAGIQRGDAPQVAEALGSPSRLNQVVRQIESAGNDKAVNDKTGAAGRYQMHPDTWRGLVNTPEGKAAGLTIAGIMDPNQQEIGMTILKNQNAAAMRKVGINPTEANVAFLHFMGAPQGIKFINAMKANPNANAAALFPDEAKDNGRVFYQTRGKHYVLDPDGNRIPRTLLEVYQLRTPGLGGVPYHNKYADLQALPLAQQQQIRSQAETTMLKQEQAANTAAQQQYKMQLDEVKIQAMRGDFTPVMFEQAFQTGFFQSAADYKAIKDAIDGFQAGVKNLAHGQQMQKSGKTFDPYTPANRDGADALYDSLPDGPKKLETGIDWGLKMGVMPKKVVSDLRTAMLSNNPTIQLEALNTASKILQDYPNAFAGIEHKDVVENNALWFNQQLTATGDHKKAQDYVNQRNDPANAQKFKVRDEEAAQFKKELSEKDAAAAVQKLLDDTWFFTDIGNALIKDPGRAGAEAGPVFRPEFQAGQKNRAIQAYAEHAYEGYRLTGNKDGAKIYAENKMKQTWGVYNGKIMEFPPNKAYPADPDGNHTYIGVQAAKDIEKTILAETGQIVKVDPSQVIFMPLDNGRTAQDFATRQRPPRYALYYYTNKDGIPDLHMMRQPGSIRQGEWWSYGPDFIGPPIPPGLVEQETIDAAPKVEDVAREHFNLLNEMVNLRRKMDGLPPVEPRQAIPKPPQTFEPRPWNQGYDPRADALRDQRNMKANRTGGGPR